MSERPTPETAEDILPTLDDFAGWPKCGPLETEVHIGPVGVRLKGLDERLQGSLESWLGEDLRWRGDQHVELNLEIEVLASGRPHYLKAGAANDSRLRLETWKESGARLMASHGVALLMDSSGESGMACLTAQDDARLQMSLQNLIRVAVAWRLARSERGLLLHGAAVLGDEKARLFLAPSGGGKSTAARLAAPAEVVCDDAVLLSLDGECWRVHETPLWAEADFPGRAARGRAWPVALGCSLRKAEQPAVAGLSLARAVALVAAHAPFMIADEDTGSVARLSTALARSVPMAELSFAAVGSFWQALDAYLDEAGSDLDPSTENSQ